MISPVFEEIKVEVDQDVLFAGPSSAKLPIVENSILESLRASLKDEIPSEIKNSLAEFQSEILKLLKPKTSQDVREEPDNKPENETRNFYTPTKSVWINSTENDDSCVNRNKSTAWSALNHKPLWFRARSASNKPFFIVAEHDQSVSVWKMPFNPSTFRIRQ